MTVLPEGIIRLLTEAQDNQYNHPKLLKSLNSLLDKHIEEGETLETFFNVFFAPFSNVLFVYKRHLTVLRVIDFSVKFAVSTAPRDEEADQDKTDEDNDQEVETTFFSLFLNRLLSLHEARDKAVRFRVCQLVSKLLSLAADEDCVIGISLFDKVQEVMLDRVLDKVPVVRVHAVSALEFLQTPLSNCPVSSTFLSLLAEDSSPEVRRCILNKIAVWDHSMPAVIERTRDVKELIRRDAFLWLANNCSIKHLTIQQRIQLLNDGLNDHCELVQEACVNGLLRSWSLESLNGDFIALLSRLDVESSSEVAGLALWKLFDNLAVDDLVSSLVAVIEDSHTSNQEKEEDTLVLISRLSVTPSQQSESRNTSLIDNEATPTPLSVSASVFKVFAVDSLYCEEAFYWSQLCCYLHAKGPEAEEKMELIIPTTSEFCDYLQRYVEEVLLVLEDVQSTLQCQFIIEQLCKMLSVMDHSDEVGRRRLAKLVCDFLTLLKFPTSLIQSLLSQQTQIWPQESHRVEVFMDVIAELRQPSSANATVSQECVVDSTINSTFFTSQSLSNMSGLDLNNDTDTLLRCLIISCEMLKELKQQRLSPALRMLVDVLLIPCVQNETPYVRDMALSCLGLASLLDVHLARELLLLFVQVSQVDHESVQGTALKIVFDLLHVFGFEAFSIGAVENGNIGKPEEDKEAESEGVATDSGGKEGDETGEADADRNNETMQRLLNIMAKFLEGESSFLSEVAAEGIAKLLLSRRILSQKLVAKLLILWYNPLAQEECRLRSVLGAFFPMFAASDRSCRECLSEVYLPVLTSVFEAPPTSPLYEVDSVNMADFLIQLTQPMQTAEECVHDSLAFVVSNEVLSEPSSMDVRVFCRSLSQMTFTPSNRTNAGDLLILCEKMKQTVTDKISLKYLDKFKDSLKTINPSITAGPAGEQLSEVTLPEGAPGEPVQVSNKPPDSCLATPISTRLPKAAGTTKPKAKTTEKVRPTVATVTKHRLSTKPKAKTTGKTRSSVAMGTKARGQSRRRVVKFETSSSEEETDNENLEPTATQPTLPTRGTSTRESKRIATKRIATAADTIQRPLLNSSEESEDDSLLGEHSPFIKRTAGKSVEDPPPTRQSAGPLKVLQYSDEDS